MCGTCLTAPAQSEIIHLCAHSFGGPRLRQLLFYKSRRRHRIPFEPLLYPPLDNQMAFKIFSIVPRIRAASSSIFLPGLMARKRESTFFPAAHPKATREEIQYLSAECFSNSPKGKKTSWLMQIKKANSISLFIYLMHPLSALCSTARASL